MPFSFSTALSGLRASTDKLGVTGNNIANANTTAFKSSSITFEDVFSNSLGTRLNGSGGSMQIGSGVVASTIPTNFAQGGLEDNGSETASAIQGKGFYVLKNDAGAQVYTRAGNFTVDRQGYMVSPNGSQVQGYTAVGGSIPAGSALLPIKIPIGEITPPIITSQIAFKMNLNSADQPGAVFHSPAQVYDSKGVAHTFDVIFTKQLNGSFAIASTVDGNPAVVDTGVDPPFLVFDSFGVLTAPQILTVTPDQTLLGGGAVLPLINFNLFQTNPDGTQGPPYITNYATTSAVAAVHQDGYAAGGLTGLSMSPDQDGVIFAVFSNGQIRPLAQLALATFNAQDGLKHLGGNAFAETPASGQPSIGAAGTGGRGAIVGGVLEQSNVDIAGEFTDLIVAQRSFQANSRVITTISQTLQDLINNVG